MLEGWLVFFRGLSVCRQRPKLWLLVIPPVLLNFLLFAGLFYLGSEYFAPFFMDILQKWIGGIPVIIRYVVMGLFIYVFYLFVVYFFNALGLLIGGFFYTVLAGSYYRDLKSQIPGGTSPSSTVHPGFVQVLRYEAIKFLVLTVGGAVVSLLSWLMPYLSPAFLFLLVLMLAFEYFDYAFEGMRLTYVERFVWIRKNLWKFFSAGLVVYLILSIPLIGFLLSPICVVGATDIVFSRTQGLVG